MAAYSPACHAPAAIGLLDIKIAVPYNGSLTTLGHTEDQTQLQTRGYHVDVPGDRNGGHSGPPIEIQQIGEVMHCRLVLSSFNQTGINLALTRAVRTTNGVIAQSEVGQFLMTSKAMRLLLHASTDANTKNFWCALLIDPFEVGAGTKYSSWVLPFQCHRPPCGHGKANILYDTNSDAYS